MTQAQANVEREGDCWRCTQRVGLSPFCSSCEAPQPLAAGADHFTMLGVPRRLVLDPLDLEQRYHEASRRLHPDRHQAAGDRERALSLAASAALNRAYRTLREPIGRGRYWLELHGDTIGADNNRVPPELACVVFEVQQQLAELRQGQGDGAAVAAARDALTQRLDGSVTALEARYREWDAARGPAMLVELKRRLSEIAYLRTLVRDVDAVLAG